MDLLREICVIFDGFEYFPKDFREVKKITSALISVYHKEGLEEIVRSMDQLGIRIYSTGGTYEFIAQLGVKATRVEDVTSYPPILGGRVKTLHPKIFGGILFRRDREDDHAQAHDYDIPVIDMVIVDLYPFEETVLAGGGEEEIIEKIDIGGISLIRAAAKNFHDVAVIASREKYPFLREILKEKNGATSLEDRRHLAAHAFHISSHYDTAIFRFMNDGSLKVFKASIGESEVLRYGENPHQEGVFYGRLEDHFEQIHGKAISYNNLGDLEAAIELIREFSETTFAILKHNNACGVASRRVLKDAWKDALAGDPVSAFGGVLVTNSMVDPDTADEINKLFFEIILAPGYDDRALETLKSKKNRIILRIKPFPFTQNKFRSLLNGVIEQDRDAKMESASDLQQVTKRKPTEKETEDLIFANKIVKHTKSNAIVLAKEQQLIGSGTGQTSRVDALRQAIGKARDFELDTGGAVMASDAFFPFADSVRIAREAGITAVIQPGGSVRDQESVEYCNQNDMAMVLTGTRHFKH